MTYQEFISNKDLVAEYERWINQDIGIIVRSVLLETFCTPSLPREINLQTDAQSVAICLGSARGAREMLAHLSNLANRSVAADSVAKETYGVKPETKGN